MMADDIDRIMKIMEEAFDPYWGEAWNRRQISDSLALPTTHYRLMAHDGSSPRPGEPAAGFTLSRHVADEEELLLVAVTPEARRQGLGMKLLEQLAHDARARGAKKLFLEMRANNPAERLYRRAGYEPIGLRRDYYLLADGGRADAVTLACTL